MIKDGATRPPAPSMEEFTEAVKRLNDVMGRKKVNKALCARIKEFLGLK